MRPNAGALHNRYRTHKDIYSNKTKPYRVYKRERGDGAMFLYPAFITPSTLTISLYLLTLPAIVIILLVWFIRKMNRIDKTLIEILKEIKLSKKDKE